MPVKLPDAVTRRVAVILGTSGSGQQLLNFLQPLLGKDTEIDLQGVFIEDDALQRAAALPFKELCRLTLSVREIHSDQPAGRLPALLNAWVYPIRFVKYGALPSAY